MRSARIVGGANASFGEWPWMVKIQESNSDNFCGGVILSADFILTTASCQLFLSNNFVMDDELDCRLFRYVYIDFTGVCINNSLFYSFQRPNKSLLAVFGKVARSEDGNPKTVTKIVKQILVHPKYNDYTYENDIALLQLENGIQFDEHIGKNSNQSVIISIKFCLKESFL